MAYETLFCSGMASHPDHRPDAKQLRRIRAELGMVFQRYNLFSHRTALENITEAPVRVLGVTRQEANNQARELLAQVNLEHRAGHYPDQLSGGEQQRVAIARALAMQPKLMLSTKPPAHSIRVQYTDTCGRLRRCCGAAACTVSAQLR